MKAYKYRDLVDPDGEKFGDEPIILFRAQDRFAPLIIAEYIRILETHGYDVNDSILRDMWILQDQFNEWQKDNEIKNPD